jgi:hypothetical protein
MKTVAILSALAAVSGLVSATPTKTTAQKPNKRADLPAVTASGNAFWAGKERFYIRGIDYQPGGSSGQDDPLADETVCKRDIAEFKKLGVNTIRVYMTDNSKDHDTCMNALADAGIYVILDANNPLYSPPLRRRALVQRQVPPERLRHHRRVRQVHEHARLLLG